MASSGTVPASMEPPPKRARLTSPTTSISSNSTSQIHQHLASTPNTATSALPDPQTLQKPKIDETGMQPARELEVGILCVVNNSNPGFEGTLKHRYTDFLVNEITPDGVVAHLTCDTAPKVAHAAQSTSEQRSDEVKAETVPLSTSPTTEKPTEVVESDSVATAAAPATDDVETIKLEDKPKEDVTPFSITPEDEELLVTYFNADFKDELLQFHQKILAKPAAKPSVFGSIDTPPITDRVLRGKMHGDVRRIFDSRLETEVQDKGVVRVTAAPPVKVHPEGYGKNHFQNQRQPRQQRPQNQTKGKVGWQELGGEYLHFSLYKENKDTMEVVNVLSRGLKTGIRDFAFAGTKDRRAVTVQRVSVRRQHAARLANLNRELRNARIGDFKYEKHQLELGELQGNQFHITLRDCHFGADDTAFDIPARLKLGNEVVGAAVENLKTHGFLNYFGLQRFGTFGIGTDEVGKKILSGDFEGAVNSILTFNLQSLEAASSSEELNRVGRDDIARAEAIDMFKKTGKGHAALERMPRKFSGERAVIQFLASKPNNFIGALQSIPRNLKLMYVHAYQSLVWNYAASERWTRYGSRVIEGDLVIVEKKAEREAAQQEEVDEAGEVIVRPAADDFAVTHDDLFERARSLSAEEAASGDYSVFDIVLPLPGFDIEYPANDVGDFYKEFMASPRGGGLDPGNMRRNQKDFSLSGSYRKVIARVLGEDVSYEIKTYIEDTEQLVETDLEKLMKSKPSYKGDRQNNSFEARKNGTRENQSNGRGGRGGTIVDSHNKRNAGPSDNGSSRTLEKSGVQFTIDGHEAETREVVEPAKIADIGLVSNGSDEIPSKKRRAGEISENEFKVKDTIEQAEQGGELVNEVEGLKEEPSAGVTIASPQPAKIAVILKLDLGTSQYATMALRELMGASGVNTYKPDFSGGR